MLGRRLIRRAVIPALPALLILAPVVASACTLDGKATAFANGSRAALTRTKLTTAIAPTWAPFSFRGHYRAGAAIRFSEDQKQLSGVLPAAVAHSPWRWDFGDKTRANGKSVTHRYTHPGTYRVIVSVYYPSWHQYYAFDEIRIAVAAK